MMPSGQDSSGREPSGHESSGHESSGRGRGAGGGRIPLPAVVPALAVLALLVGACGFHPRGAVELPPGVSKVYVQAPSALLGEPIAMYLEAGGARQVTDRADADVAVLVTGERQDRRLLAVDPRTGKAREYELSYALTYQLARKDGSAILPPQTVSLVRDYTFDPTAVIAMGEEEALIYAEMRRDAVQQVLRRLRFALRGEGAAGAGQP